MKWVYNIPTPPFKFEFMMICLKQLDAYICTWVYIGPNNMAMVTLYNYSCPEKLRKEAKPHGENPPSRKEKAQNLKHVFNMSLSSL